MVICKSNSYNWNRVTGAKLCQVWFNRYFTTRVIYYQATISKHTGVCMGVQLHTHMLCLKRVVWGMVLPFLPSGGGYDAQSALSPRDCLDLIETFINSNCSTLYLDGIALCWGNRCGT